jgi:hypothetical protein
MNATKMARLILDDMLDTIKSLILYKYYFENCWKVTSEMSLAM